MSKLCPFRKITYFMDTSKGGKEFLTHMGCATYSTQDFEKCYEDQCAVYDRVTQTCGMVNQAWRI